MPSGVPIRLVQQNGNLIELEAQSMTLTTSRKVGGSPLPFTGSKRIGIDLNVNSAMINIQGVIPDDREGTTSTAHSGTVDFGNTVDGDSLLSTSNLVKLTSQRLQLQQKYDTDEGFMPPDIYGVIYNTASSGDTRYDSSVPAVLVNTGNATAAELATATAAYINGQHSASHTAVILSGVDSEGVTGNNIVKISFTLVGNDSRRSRHFTPSWTLDAVVRGYFFDEPKTTKFSGGSFGGKKSAGDKAMDLYGIINNSKSRGRVSNFLTRGKGGWGDFVPGRVDGRELEVKDYITGIQIPYNSTIQAASGELYVARNFFMPTGYYTGLQKTSEGNMHAASVTFDTGDETSGIQGSVQKFDIMYDAGETVYTFNLIFAPIDNLILS